MAVTDSTFCFKFSLKEVHSLIPDKDFVVTNEFADIFKFEMLDPLEDKPIPRGKLKKVKPKKPVEPINWQSIEYEGDIATLMDYMNKYPMELSLWKKSTPFAKEGVAVIPWHNQHLNFIKRVANGATPTAVTVNNAYSVYSYNNSKKMAAVKLAIKLSLVNEETSENIKQGDGLDNLKKSYDPIQNMPPSLIYTNLLNFAHSLKPRTENNIGKVKTIFKSKNLTPENPLQTDKLTIQEITDENQNNEDIVSILNKKKHEENFKMIKKKFNHESKLIDIDHVTSIKWLNYIKSDTELENDKTIKMRSTRSTSLIHNKHSYNLLKYILPVDKPIRNQIFFVGYMSIQNDNSLSSQGTTPPKDTTPPKGTTPSKDTTTPKGATPSIGVSIQSSQYKEEEELPDKFKYTDCVGPCHRNQKKYSFKICDPKCPVASRIGQKQVTCELDIPAHASHLVKVTPCDHIRCEERLHPIPLVPRDDRILIDMANPDDVCCEKSELLGGVYTKLAIDGLPCECTCSCHFGFVKRTTFCEICRGIEEIGEDMDDWLLGDKPHLCPIYHNLFGKKPKPPPPPEPKKKCPTAKMPKNIFGDRKHIKNAESGADSGKKDKKKIKKETDERFKFNYGYSAPQIGHSQCLLPCSGNHGVPKNMGWLWTSENIPGLKFRPFWKPGATNKHVVRMLRIARNPNEAKKKKRSSGQEKKKKNEKRPYLIVHKKSGEFNVTMETMKNFAKTRAVNQYPYEDKPLITYTVGRTDEENRLRKLRKERKQRRQERLQRKYIQSAFKDLCAEICLKTYQQALQILPHEEDPPCICYPAEPNYELLGLENSCSCSDDKEWTSSDTDNDEWFVEFTPPNAKFDPTYNPPKIFVADKPTQYSYLDYRVKKNDYFGNPVPRFFLGPEGKQVCSDLGGFWGPGKKWFEIGIDGFVAPDGRWCPMSFIGPTNEMTDAEGGKFTLQNGHTYYVGVHGYVEKGKWHFYPKPREMPAALKKILEKEEKKKVGGTEKHRKDSAKRGKSGDKKKDVKENASKEWSCFGNVSPRELSKLGVMGHGHDRALLLESLKQLIKQGKDVKIPEPYIVPKSPLPKNARKRLNPHPTYEYYAKRYSCRHHPPSKKGIVATDAMGHKVYFSFRPEKSTRPKERVNHLKDRGISISSFHLPCFNSFITREMIRNEVNERRLNQTRRKSYR